MTLAELLEKLKTTDGFGPDAVAVVTSSTEALREEAKGYRLKHEGAAQKLGRLAEKLGVSVDGDLESALEARAKASTKGGSDELAAQVARLRQDLESEQKRRGEAETKARTTSARSSIVDALTKNKAARPDDLADLHISRAKFREDGTAYFVDHTGAERSVEEYVGAWLKDRPELIQSTQQRGPGGPGAPPQNSGKKAYTEEQYNEAVRSNDTTVLNELAQGKAVVASST